MAEEHLDNSMHSLVPHSTGFPYSRDFAAHVACDNERCICHGYDGCTVPSNCEIDDLGRCKWYLKQLMSKPK